MHMITASKILSSRRRRTMPAYFLGRPVDVYVARYARRRQSA